MARRWVLGAALMVTGLAPVRGEGTVVRDFQNGLKWIHRPVSHNRIFAFQLFIPGGKVQEPLERAGITQLMTATMLKGTAGRSALQLAQEVESLGASFGVDAHPDAIAAGGQVIVDKWGKTLDLFQDVLLNPSFPEGEVEKEREALLNVLHTNEEHIFSVAEERFRKELFGDHPYGRPDEGTRESLTRLTREDLAAWHRSRLIPPGAVLVTVGNVPRTALTKRIEALAEVWVSSGVAASLPPLVAYPTTERLAEERKPFEQSYVMLGYPAPSATDPRYPVMKLMNALLGGGMSSPLFQTVREEGTLAYEVSSFYPSRRGGSSFVVYAGMDPKNLALAEQKVRSVLAAFAARLPSAQEVQDAKTYIRGHYLMDHQTNARLAWYLGWWELLGKGHAYDAVYPTEISRVTPEDLGRLIQETLGHPSVTVRVISQGAASHRGAPVDPGGAR